MSAFGPYKDKIEIDFNKLGNNDIFLITGDTGAGKTTIFDAISFALFGVSSGSRRENSSFRSDFALDETETSVYLEFMHKGIFYQLERIPRYSRKKKRGDGVTFVGGDASLTFLEEVITGDKNVTDKCISILGMNSNQFKQIVMIAQGEFMELLLAKPKDRANIFRHIFDTDVFKNISDNLKDKYLEKKREYEDNFLSINGYIESILFDDEVMEGKTTDEIIQLLELEIKNDSEKESKLEQEYQVFFQKSSRLVKEISEVKLLNDSIITLDKCKESLNELLEVEDSYLEKESAVNKNKEIYDKVEPYRLEVLRIEGELKNKRNSLETSNKEYEKILLKYNEISKLYEKNSEKEQEVKCLEKVILELENQLSLIKEIEELESEKVDLLEIYNGLELKKLKDILHIFDECQKLEIELEGLRANLMVKKDKYVADNKNYLNQYDLFLSSQAGILASNLVEGEPCPVCGSLEHPNIAHQVSEVLSKEKLEFLKKALENDASELENYRLKILEKEKLLALLKKDIDDIQYDDLVIRINQLKDSSNSNIELENYNINDLEVKIASIEDNIQGKKQKFDSLYDKRAISQKLKFNHNKITILNKEIAETKNSYDEILKDKVKLESFVKVMNEDIIQLKNGLEISNDRYIESYKQLGYCSEKEVFEIKLDKEGLSLLEKDVREYKDKVSELKNKISTLNRVIAGRSSGDTVKLEEKLNVVNEKLNNSNLSLKNINNKISNNKKIFCKLKDVSEKATKLEKEVMIYKDLSDTANGTIAGKSKLEFEQFVQASYFDRVLTSANKRFLYMTDDRYELFRKEEAIKISDKLGLEIEVMDYYTGKKRDIKSLSGGESFKASLSLALGMSDVIQEFAGGVVVDAMFIDEGFGSLDDESLDQAMNAIMMISQENKMIGIISHVNELKDRIDKKIIVKKSSTGSSVSIVV